MILHITPAHVIRAHQARMRGELLSHTCPTAQCLADLGIYASVGMKTMYIRGSHEPIFISDKNLIKQIDAWTFSRTFEPGDYEVTV